MIKIFSEYLSILNKYAKEHFKSFENLTPRMKKNS